MIRKKTNAFNWIEDEFPSFLQFFVSWAHIEWVPICGEFEAEITGKLD